MYLASSISFKDFIYHHLFRLVSLFVRHLHLRSSIFEKFSKAKKPFSERLKYLTLRNFITQQENGHVFRCLACESSRLT